MILDKLRIDELDLEGIYKTAFNMVVLQTFCKDCDGDPINGFDSACESRFCYNDGVKVILEALRKQLSVEPILVKNVGEAYYKCPICDNKFDGYILDTNYCECCGIGIDWSDVNYSYLKPDNYLKSNTLELSKRRKLSKRRIK